MGLASSLGVGDRRGGAWGTGAAFLRPRSVPKVIKSLARSPPNNLGALTSLQWLYWAEHFLTCSSAELVAQGRLASSSSAGLQREC